jgi:RimJ/RimL family protein N-acetyltransferase
MSAMPQAGTGQPRAAGAGQEAGIGLCRPRAASPIITPPVLQGSSIKLRPVREADLDQLYDAHIAIADRGAYFPLGVLSEPEFRRRFAETGFWQQDDGTFVIQTEDGELAGHVEFFRPVSYWDAFELSYQLYGSRFAGRGYTTEAVRLVVDYLFATKPRNRIQLVIVPENGASRRIAEKCGFALEGPVRGAFFNDGRHHDVLLYALLRADPRPWRESATT